MQIDLAGLPVEGEKPYASLKRRIQRRRARPTWIPKAPTAPRPRSIIEPTTRAPASPVSAKRETAPAAITTPMSASATPNSAVLRGLLNGWMPCRLFGCAEGKGSFRSGGTWASHC